MGLSPNSVFPITLADESCIGHINLGICCSSNSGNAIVLDKVEKVMGSCRSSEQINPRDSGHLTAEQRGHALNEIVIGGMGICTIPTCDSSIIRTIIIQIN